MFDNWIGPKGKSVILLIGVGFTSEIVWYFYKQCRSYVKKRQCFVQKDKPINDVVFFNEKNSICRSHNFQPCSLPTCPLKYVNKLEMYLLSATKTLDICVYFLTYSPLVNCIISLQKKNVEIRVILDEESSGNDASQALILRKAGINVRSKKLEYLMHHKFAIIDQKIVITGSANWTMQAFLGNCENILITNQNKVADAYVTEFNRLWNVFDN